MDRCRNCQDQLAPAYLEGLCEACFRMVYVEQVLLARREALKRIAEYDRQIIQAIDRLNGPAPAGTKPSVLHRCICGFASPSYIDVEYHIDDRGGPDRVHGHEDHTMVPISTRKTYKSHKAPVDTGPASDEDAL